MDHGSLDCLGGLAGVALRFSGLGEIGSGLSYGLWAIAAALIFVSWIFYAVGAYGVFVMRRKEPNTPRPYKVPGYPLVPWIFIIFATVYLVLTVYNDADHIFKALRAGAGGYLLKQATAGEILEAITEAHRGGI